MLHLTAVLFLSAIGWDTLGPDPCNWDTLASATVVVPATAEVRERDDSLGITMFYSSECSVCMAMETELKQLEAAGYVVGRVNIADPKQKEIVRHYGITLVPYVVVYRGHEAVQEVTGFVRALDLARWVHRVARLEGPVGRFLRCRAQDDLGPEGRKYLQRAMSGPSCRMLWCQNASHWASNRTIVVEAGTLPVGAYQIPGEQPFLAPMQKAVSVVEKTAKAVKTRIEYRRQCVNGVCTLVPVEVPDETPTAVVAPVAPAATVPPQSPAARRGLGGIRGRRW